MMVVINGVEVPVLIRRRYNKHCSWNCPDLTYLHEKLEKHPVPETIPYCKRSKVRLAFLYEGHASGKKFRIWRCAECIGTEFKTKRKVQIKPSQKRYTTK